MAPTFTTEPSSANHFSGQVEHAGHVARPAARDDGRAECELQDQVPRDDPGEDLADRGVAVRVRAAGRRHARTRSSA